MKELENLFTTLKNQLISEIVKVNMNNPIKFKDGYAEIYYLDEFNESASFPINKIVGYDFMSDGIRMNLNDLSMNELYQMIIQIDDKALTHDIILKCPKVRNLKYKTIEQITGTCKMKDSQKGWIDAVRYEGKDRHTDKIMMFVKNEEDFINEFELV